MDVLDPSQCQRHFAQAAGSPIQGEKGLRAPLDYPSLAGSSGARGALRKALTDPGVAALARSLRVDLSDESAWEEVINRAAHALEPNGTSDAGGWEGATFTPLASLSILRKRGTGRLPHHCLALKTMPLHANATPLRQFGLQVAFQLVKGDGLAID